MEIQVTGGQTYLNPLAIVPTQQVEPNVVAAVARPFLKWVGGKTQLLSHIDLNLPAQLKTGRLAYFEPFLGGGSVFFHVAHRYPLERFIISDNNSDLILAYRTVQKHVNALIDVLSEIQSRFWDLSVSKRSELYYATRDAFNASRDDRSEDPAFKIERTAQLIFLNKTCFNGLYRVNAKGGFNVAFGRYDRPPICDPSNLLACSSVLQRANILLCDFGDVLDAVRGESFVYLDPPYRPISATSNFTSYSASTFSGADQERLAEYCIDLDKQGSLLMISNSDPKNIDPTDRYFEQTYPRFRITTLSANRMVNCKADRRGKISELLITNY
jgi:DNA adenine methylase